MSDKYHENYRKELMRIKNLGQTDFIEIFYEKKKIILKLVDTSDETVKLMSEWRKVYRDNYFSIFEITTEKTKKWIESDILGDPTRIQFMIYLDDKKVGNIGHGIHPKDNDLVVFTSMIKSPDLNFPGLMTVIEKVYLRWIFESLESRKIFGELFSDNESMMKVHLKCGWKKISKFTMNKIPMDEGWRWTKAEKNDGEREMTAIEITKEELLEKFGRIDYKILQ